MHDRLRPDHTGPERRAYALMAETDSQGWDARPKFFDDRAGESGFFWCARTGRDDDLFGAKGPNLRQGNPVIENHAYLGPEFTEIVVEIVRKGVVIIDEEDQPIYAPRSRPRRVRAL